MCLTCLSSLRTSLFSASLLLGLFLSFCAEPIMGQTTSKQDDISSLTPIAMAKFDSLAFLFRQIYSLSPEESLPASTAFASYADTLIRKHPNTEFPWSEITGLMYFKSANRSMQFINWSVPSPNGSSSYAGLVWVKDSSSNYHFYLLQDFSYYMPSPDQMILSSKNWWGAYYYQCIEHHPNDTTYFTLLGVNNSQNNYAQKVIDIMRVAPNGTLSFGACIFDYPFASPPLHNKTDNKKEDEPNSAPDYGLKMNKITKSQKDAPHNNYDYPLCRVVFRYKSESDLILRYDYQTYRSDKTKKEKLIKDYMIVFDRLIWNGLSLSDSYAAYVPAGDTYDAFLFKNGYWKTIKGIIARNPEPEIHTKKRTSKAVLYKR